MLFLAFLPFYDGMKKESESVVFFQSVNFDFFDSLENKYKQIQNYLFKIDGSSGEICNFQAFVEIATAGRPRRLGTYYIKQNCFIKVN